MEAFRVWVSQLNLDALWNLLITVGSCLVCITFHEMCHGLAAYALGDPTAKQAGRLTMNPMKHIDIFGLVMLAVAKFGWAKPVPVNMRNFRDPKAGMALTALAGPISNLILAWISTMLYAVTAFYFDMTGSQVFWYLTLFFMTVTYLSVGLAVFNFLPVPPLDGSKVLLAVLPPKAYAKLMRYERYGMFLLMALLLTGVLDTPLAFVRGLVLDGLSAIGLWPYDVLYGIYF